MADKKKIDKKIGKFVNKKQEELRKEIPDQGIYQTKIEFIKGQKAETMDNIKKQYYNLLTNKKVREDKKLIDDILIYRKEILQHRINAQITLYSGAKALVTFTAYHILFEHGQEATNYWIGQVIDMSIWTTHLQAFYNHMKPFEIQTMSTDQQYIFGGTYPITNIDIGFTFA